MKKNVRGFTLIEVAVATVITVTVAAVGLGVYAQAAGMSSEARTRAQMDRDASVALDTIQHDLSYLGVGVPPKKNGDDGSTSLFPVIREARADGLVFQGDLPFPNSDFNGIATIVDIDDCGVAPAGLGAPGHCLLLSSELSGPCPPSMTGAPAAAACSTKANTLIGITPTGGDDCTQASSTARTCPWGMNKWPKTTAGSQLFWTISDPGGNWFQRTNRADAGMGYNAQAGNFGWGIHLEHGPPLVRLAGKFGGTFVANIDRLFLTVEGATNGSVCTPTGPGTPGNCRLRRTQCWANPMTSTPAAGSAGAISSAALPAGCTPAGLTKGTPWETVVTGLKSLTFNYYDKTGALLGTPLVALDQAKVRAVEVEIAIERLVPGTTHTVNVTMTRRYFLSSGQDRS